MELINRPHRPYFSPIPQSDDALDIIGNTGWIFSEIIQYGVTNTVKAHTEEYKYFLLFDFNTFIPKTLKAQMVFGMVFYFLYCALLFAGILLFAAAYWHAICARWVDNAGLC
jgi:hypothetical protein